MRFLLVAVACGFPGVAMAGMSSFALTELAEARLEVISFFLMGFLAMTFVVKWAWNTLGEAVEWMPRLGFKQSLCLVLLSRLLLYVVLTMISGARELMTPGAWERKGFGYKLAGEERGEKVEPAADGERESGLRRLHWALVKYAAEHGGALPTNRELSGIDEAVWRGADGVVLGYVTWLTMASEGDRVLAYEIVGEGRKRMVLQLDGTVVEMSAMALQARLKAETDRVATEVGGE